MKFVNFMEVCKYYGHIQTAHTFRNMHILVYILRHIRVSVVRM